MAFIQPCFIRKNTRELRYKLSELGYTYSNCDNLDLDYIITFPSKGMYSIFADYHFKNEHFEKIWKIKYIDCGDNEELFLALAAMRDDTDINRWFKDLETNELFICTKHSIYDMATTEDLEEYGDWIGIGMCKYQIATVEEIIEHFKNK